MHNVNDILQKVEYDLCGDETILLHGGMGDYSSGLMNIVEGKPNITTDGMIVMVTDVGLIRPWAYLLHHKLNYKKLSFIKYKPNKIWIIFENLKCFIVGCKQKLPPGLNCFFCRKPHMTWDSYFSKL